MESRARRRAPLWSWDWPRNRPLIGIENGDLSDNRLPIFSSQPESFHYVFIGRSPSINKG